MLITALLRLPHSICRRHGRAAGTALDYSGATGKSKANSKQQQERRPIADPRAASSALLLLHKKFAAADCFCCCSFSLPSFSFLLLTLRGGANDGKMAAEQRWQIHRKAKSRRQNKKTAAAAAAAAAAPKTLFREPLDAIVKPIITMQACMLIVCVILHVACSVAAASASSSALFDKEICQYPLSTRKNQVSIYWVNMDKSTQRRETMQAYLDAMGVVHERVRGLTLTEIMIPSDIQAVWNTMSALYQTSYLPPARHSLTPSSVYYNYTTVVTGLYGRKKKNRLAELGCTISHLMAMRRAIYHNTTSSRFALIIEDDVQFPFDVDWEAMAATAPKGFGMLQLFNSNEESMESLYKNYIHTKRKKLWHERLPKQPASFWSTCAYLIDREVMRPIVDAIVNENKETGWIEVKIIAGMRWECCPKYSPCCLDGGKNYTYTISTKENTTACIWAPRGFQADSFLYSTTNSYVQTMPLISNGLGGNQSTFHQDHVEMFHQRAFARQRGYINEMLSGKVIPPPFANAACKGKLLEINEMKVKKRSECIYAKRNFAASPAVYWLHDALSVNASTRRTNMEAHLKLVGLHNKLVPTARVDQLFMPADVNETWSDKNCVFSSVQADQALKAATEAAISASGSEVTMFVVEGLCGRKNQGGDHLKQLSVTLSHLMAMRAAVYDNITSSRFALIIEDDVQFPFDVDWEAMAATAPKGFGMLQLFYSNEYILSKIWRLYQRNDTLNGMWTDTMREGIGLRADTWATRAYLIDRVVAKEVLDAIIKVEAVPKTKARIARVKVLAGFKRPCVPKECCSPRTTTSATAAAVAVQQQLLHEQDESTIWRPPCILSTRGFQAEAFLYNLMNTHTLFLPIVTNYLQYQFTNLHRNGGGEDFLDNWHWAAFSQHRQYMNEITEGFARTPKWLVPACNVLLSKNLDVLKNKRLIDLTPNTIG